MPKDLRHSSDQLRILYTLYAVFFTLGLSTVYRYVPPARPGNLLEIMLAVVITFVALRFIFVVEAFSKYLIDSGISKDAHTDPSAKDAKSKRQFNRKYWYVTIIHFPLIFLHAFFFYRLCLSYKTLFYLAPGSEKPLPQYDDFALYFGLLLFVDICWLVLARVGLSSERARKFSDNGDPLKDGWNSFWLGNNVFFLCVLIAFCFLTVRGFIPKEIEIHSSHIPMSVIGFGVCAMGNSIADLFWTARFYIPQLQKSDE